MTTFGENQGLARTYIPSLLKQGLSANVALGFLKEQGLGYRRTKFLADWREAAGFEAKKDTFKYIRKDYKPTVSTITETSESLSKEYSYIFEIKGVDSLTGEEKTLDWRYSTDDLVSIAEAESIAEESMLEPYYETGITEYKVSAVGVKRSLVL